VLSGDFGMSVLTSQPVLSDLIRVFPATFELSTFAIIIGVALGVPAGVVAAARKGRWQDHVIRVLGLFGYSVPVFWLGLIGLFVFYGKLGWTAGTGRLDVFYDGEVTLRTGIMLIDAALDGNWEIFSNAFSHLILPAGILGYFSMAYIARMTRSFMIDQLSQEYVIAARIKGNSFWQAVWRHAFPNIMVPLITVIGLSYASLLEGAVLTETVFAWPGLGLYITQALFNSDMNAVLGGTVLVGTVFIGINLLCDLLYKLFDPRLRT
jgi:peptide/nickel transport system permease protein